MQHRGVLTPQSQLLYVVQWLGEFSEIEKDDFLQELLELYAPGQLPVGQVLDRVKFEDRPPTLFQCRMDLLKEWFESWSPEAEREELLSRIRESDSEFFERFDKSRSVPNEQKVVEEFWTRNGNCNVTVYGFSARNGYTASEGENNGHLEGHNQEGNLTNVNGEGNRQNGLQSFADKDVAPNGLTESVSNEPAVNHISSKDDSDESGAEKASLTSLDKQEIQTSEQGQKGDGNTETNQEPSSAESCSDSIQALSIEVAGPAEIINETDETVVYAVSPKCKGDTDEAIVSTSGKTETDQDAKMP